MNIFLESHIRRHQTLLDIMFGIKPQNVNQNKTVQTNRRDTFTVSHEAQERTAQKAISGRTRNTDIDSVINLQEYVDAAAKRNQEALENAGSKIDVNAVTYTSASAAFRRALTDKYARLAAEAETHADPEGYIYEKYFGRGSQYYETDLTDVERSIGYNNEMRMYKEGKICGVSYQDSLFRGKPIYGDVIDNDRILFQRQIVSRQISNILSDAGIDPARLPDTCAYTVDPYSYQISVDGVDESLKLPMEQVLNQGDNGKNLYKHILTCSTQDGCNSTQISADSKLKFQAFQEVYRYTSLDLRELDERNSTYYTKEGKDIKELIQAAVSQSDQVPGDYKAQVKQWICDMISDISGKGWNNVADMKLSILFQSGRLVDTKQDIIFAKDSAWIKNKIGSSWYSVSNKS